MATSLRHHTPPGPLSHAQHTLPRLRALELSGVHLEQEESGDEAELPGIARVHGAVPALGPDGIQLGVARDGAEG